jgi:hypothetical protein
VLTAANNPDIDLGAMPSMTELTYIAVLSQGATVNSFPFSSRVGTGFELLTGNTSGVGNAFIRITTTTVQSEAGLGGLNDNFTHTYFGTWKTGFGTRIYVDRPTNSGTGAAAGGTLTSGQNLKIGTRSTTRWTGFISLLLVGTKQNIDAGLALLENPWQIFKPQQAVFYSLPGGNLFSALDETVSDRNDYILSSTAGQVYQTTLSPVAQPGAGTNIDFNFDAESPEDSGSIKFDLLSGPTTVKSQTVPLARNWAGRIRSPQLRKQPQGNAQIDPRVDLVWTPSQSLGWTRGANGAIKYGRNGAAWNVAASSSAFLSTANTAKSAAITLIAVVKFNSLTATTFSGSSTDNGAVIYSQRTLDVDNSPTLCVSGSFTGGPMRVWFGRDTSGVAFGKANTLVTIQTGVWYSIAVSCDVNGVTGIVVNGLSNATQVSVAGSWSAGWSGATAYVGTQRLWPAAANDDANIEVSLFARIPQNIRESELVSLSNNPWQIFRPPSRAVCFPSPAQTSFPITPSDYSVIDTPRYGRFLPKRWRQQPQGAAQVNWSNQLTRGLRVALHPIGSRFYDVTNYKAAAHYLNTSIVASPSGVGLNGIGVTADGGVASQFYTFFPASASYVVCGFSVDPYWHGISYVSHSLGGFATGPNSSQFGVATDAYSTGRTVSFRLMTQNSDGGGSISFTNLLERGKPFVYGATRVTGANGHRVFSAGRLLGSADGGTGGIGPYGGTVDAGNAAYYGSGNTILMVAYWERALSDAEMVSVTSEPWQIFRPNPGRIYGLPAAGGWPWTPTLRVTSL